MDEAAEPPDPYLKSLKDGMGLWAWKSRVESAQRREACLKAVLAFQQTSSCTFSKACRVAGGEVRLSTLRRWAKRYEAHGVWGLFDRKGRTIQHYNAHVHNHVLQGSPRGKKALSFIKWAGSKRAVMKTLLQAVPGSYQRYLEPMVGSGTLFFALCNTLEQGAVLGDVNPSLVETYTMVRNHVDALVALLRTYPNTQPFFLQLRAQDPSLLTPLERAARFIYLNKTCFNGLYRVNKKGQFNVPYGHIPHAHVCDEHALRVCSEGLQKATLYTGGFEKVLDYAQKGDLVYLDPPYYRHHTQGHLFQHYHSDRFGAQEHARLAEVAHMLSQKGCWVMISNADTPEVRQWYAGWHVDVLHTRRAINAQASERAGFAELLLRNYAF